MAFRRSGIEGSINHRFHDQSSLQAGYSGSYAFRTAEEVTAPAPPRDRYSYLGR